MLWGKERKGECRRSVSEPALWMKAQRCTLRTCTGEKKWKSFFLVSECTFINSSVSLTPAFQLDLCQGYWGGCFNTVALIFQLNSRAHRECQFCRLQLPGRCAPSPHQQHSEWFPASGTTVWLFWSSHNLHLSLSRVFFSLFSLCLSGIVTQRHNPSRINKFFIIHLAAVGRFSQPCTLAGYEASPPWYPRELWFERRRSGRWALGWDWPGPAQRGLP